MKRGKPPKINRRMKIGHEMLGLDHFHFGLSDSEILSLDAMRAAQERFSDILFDWIEPNVKTILDVGCGIGANAAKLKGLGYEVEGLTPDTYGRDLFRERTGLPCHLVKFEHFNPSHPFDLVLMSESSHKISEPTIFRQATRVAPGGQLLVADIFSRVKDGTNEARVGHHLEGFRALGQKGGFELIREEDFTDRVTPNLDFIHGMIDRYFLPTSEFLAAELEVSRPYLFALLRRLSRKSIQKFEQQRLLWDSAAFKRSKLYIFLSFRIPDAAALTLA